MSIGKRFRTAMEAIFGEEKVSGVAAVMAIFGGGQPVYTPKNFAGYTKEGYGKCATVYRCVNQIAGGGAQIPWSLTQDDEEVEDPEHALIKLLMRPNPFRGGARYWKEVVGFFVLVGNSYQEGISLDGVDTPSELWTQRPDRMRIIKHGKVGNVPGAYQYSFNGTTKTWPVDPIEGKSPIHHWNTFNPDDDFYGQSFLQAGSVAIDQDNYAGAWNLSLLQQSGRPQGAYKYAPANTVGATLTKDQRDQLRQDLENNIKGKDNAGKDLILDGGLEYERISLTPAEMDWLEGKVSSAREICTALGVPPQIIGLPGSQTFANYEEARLALYEDTIIPIMDSLTDELNHWLVPAFGEGLKLKLDLDEVPALAPRREKVWSRVTTSDWLTINEKREQTGYDRIDDPAADAILVDAGKVPIVNDKTPDHLDSETEAGETDEPVETDASATPADTGGKPATPGGPNLPGSATPTPAPAAGSRPLGAPPDQPPAPIIPGSGNAAPTDSVQAAALNGTQITALQGILDAVSGGQMDPEAAILFIQAAFPTLDQYTVRSMIELSADFEPTPPEPPPGTVGPDGKPIVAAPKVPGKKKPGKVPPGGPPIPKNREDLALQLKNEGFPESDIQSLIKLTYGE